MFKSWIKRTIFIFLIIGSFALSFVFAQSYDSDRMIPSFDEISPFVDSNRYTHQKAETYAFNTQDPFLDALEIETDSGLLSVDLASLAFQIENSRGYIWSSTIDYDREGFANTFKNRVRSALIIESFNTNNNNFAITEENLFEPGTTITVTEITNGFHAHITFGRTKIKVGLYVTFDSGILNVYIPQDEIVEGDVFKLSTIKVYPYFGAVIETETPGYVFLPDGIGALYDYKASDPSIGSNYQKEFYGRNMSYNLETDLSNFQNLGKSIYAPVYGFVHGVNQQAVFAYVTEGAPYGRLNLYFPSRNRGVTTVFSEYVYRRTYSQPIDRLGNVISLLQGEKNKFDVNITYHFLENEDANYVGMANTYRNLLDIEHTTSNLNDIPFRMDIIGLEKRDGLLWAETEVMTRLEDVSNMLSDLSLSGINHTYVTLHGFTKDGVTWSPPYYEKLSSRIGSSKELTEIKEASTYLLFGTEYMKASNRSRGFTQYFDLAKKISDQTYRYQSSTDIKYLLEHEKTRALLNSSFDALSSYDVDGYLIGSFGNMLYQDYQNSDSLNDQITWMQELLSSKDEMIVLYDAFDYMFEVMDAYFDMPMYSSQYIVFDDTVPFLSIALSGVMPLFAPYANFYPYARDELLRLIDFHVYPSFILTNRSSKFLQDTSLEFIYTSSYRDLNDAIKTYYHFVNDALKYVYGEKIIARDVISNGVVRVTYENDVSIIINYLDRPYNDQGTIIQAKNYVVKNN
ncbi:MAG: hypothetical protein CVV61_03100 [Tenericutes bacterium HGW-Tenericutes-6]|nr:MAG: hypothetical protein CVV61_03100 [Tenericutes bacterium HGW-Tenericutes-6]